MAGISGMTLPLARALGRFGIRVVSILPGLFDTPEMKEYEDTVMVMSKMTPFPRRLGVQRSSRTSWRWLRIIFFPVDDRRQPHAQRL